MFLKFIVLFIIIAIKKKFQYTNHRGGNLSILPRIKVCPCCEAANVIRVNEIKYHNPFRSLSDWTLIKKFNCRRCKVELGLFYHATDPKEKIIWLEHFKCNDVYYDELKMLRKSASKNKKNKIKYYEVMENIKKIEDIIQSEQVKIKIKIKIKNKGSQKLFLTK